MSAMVTLIKSQVPSYLVDSEFYKNLSADDNDEFCIPQEYFKPTLGVTNAENLAHLFHTVKFWGLRKLPHEIIELLIFDSQSDSACDRESIGTVLLEFDAEFGLNSLYQSLSECTCERQRFEMAVKCGREDVLEHLFLFHPDRSQLKTVLIKEVAENGHVHLLKRVADALSQLSIKNPFKCVSVTIVASRGHTDCLRFLFEKGCKKQLDTCRAAAENGHISCLKLAHEHGAALNKPVRNAAASHGHLDCLKYTIEHGCPVDADVACEAAHGGHFDCFRYLLDKGAKVLKRTCQSALIGGSVKCVKLLRERGAPGWDLDGVRITARHGHLACLQYLLEAGCKADHTTTKAAAQGGHDQCLSFLLETKCEARQDSVFQAAGGGHMECLRVLKKFNVSLTNTNDEHAQVWQFYGNVLVFARSLFEAGYEVPQCTIEYAIRTGYFECVEYICTNKLCDLKANLTDLAASCYTNRLPMLKLLHRYNCPWSGVDTCRQLAQFCDLESLTFAHEHGCPWDEQTVSAAIQREGQACFEYALEEGCPVSDDACEIAAGHGMIDMLKCLHERGGVLSLNTCVAAATNKYGDCLVFVVTHGAPMDASVCEAAVTVVASHYRRIGRADHETSLQMLECAHKLGCPWDERTCAAAAAHLDDNGACLEYAHTHGCPWDATTVKAAAQAGKMQNLTYALQHGCPFTVDACIAAAEHGHLSALQLLRAYHCPWDERVSRAASRYGGGSCLRYCVDSGCPIDADIMARYNAIAAFATHAAQAPVA